MRGCLPAVLLATVAIAGETALAQGLCNEKHSCAITSPRIGGVYYADQYGSIQAAVDAAGPLGAVVIPGTYAGTDGFTNANKIPVLDMRVAGPNATGFNVPYVYPGSGVVRGLNNKLDDLPSAFDFQAVADGATNDAPAIQAGINKLCSLGSWGTLYLPPGQYLLDGNGTELLKIPCQMRLLGAGMMETVLLVKSTVGASTDVIRIVGTQALEGVTLEEFRIGAQSGTPGRHDINVDTTTVGLSKMRFHHLYLGTLGGRSFASTNPTPIQNGFFLSVISQCSLNNGALIQNGGDNLIFESNKIAGANAGIDMTSVPGAVGNIIFNNNVTSTAGSIHLGGGTAGVNIIYNQLQGNVGDSGSNGANLDLDGSAANPILRVDLAGNYISPAQNTINTVRVNWVNSANLHDNTLVRAGAGTKQIITTANAKNTRLGWNRLEPEGDTLLANGLTDAGANTSYATSDWNTGINLFNRIGMGPTTFVALGTPANGSFFYCSDCTIANPCAGGGTGALAKRLNGVWVCN